MGSEQKVNPPFSLAKTKAQNWTRVPLVVSCICCAETRGKDGLAGDGPGGITHCIFKRMFFKSKACMEPPPFLFSGAIKGWGERQKEDELERYGDEETQRERERHKKS